MTKNSFHSSIILVAMAGFIAPGQAAEQTTGLSSVEINQAQAELRTTLKPILDKFLSELTTFTIENNVLAQALISSNQANKQMSMLEITKRDKLWQEYEKINPFEREMMLSPCSKALREFQNTHIVFHEILVTNTAGVNVCITNKTSDYYQADEDWWTETFAQGEGRPGIGRLNFDKSAHIDAIPLYVPIRDVQTGKVIGVLKAVLNVLNLYRE